MAFVRSPEPMGMAPQCLLSADPALARATVSDDPRNGFIALALARHTIRAHLDRLLHRVESLCWSDYTLLHLVVYKRVTFTPRTMMDLGIAPTYLADIATTLTARA